MTPLLPFPPGCVRAAFRRRIKRFTVEADGPGGTILAHTNNTGSMLGLLRPGATLLLSPAASPGRALAWTLELADFHGLWVGVNTLTPNRLLQAAWRAGLLPELAGYDAFRREVRAADSRFDARLDGPSGPLYVECKNVTLVEDEAALFPDAPTERGRRHLRDLTALAGQGLDVALFFLVQRADARCFAAADLIDPAYADLLDRARAGGVRVWPYQAMVGPEGIGLGPRLDLAP